MYRSFLAAAALSLAGIAYAVNVDGQSCLRDNPWAPRTHAGTDWAPAPDSHFFCEAGYTDGNVLTGIRIWRGDWAVWGLSFQWGELEWGKIYGTPNSNDKKTPRAPNKELTWKSSDQVSIRMKHNKGKSGRDAVGRIEVTVNDEVKMDEGSDHTDSDWLNIDSGAKKIVAVQGRSAIIAGEDNLPVETLEFSFIESNIRSSSLTDIQFAEDINAWTKLKKGIELNAALAEAWYVNENEKGGLNQTFTNGLTAKVTDSQTLQTTRSHGFGLGLGSETSVEAKLPVLVSVKLMHSVNLKYDFVSSRMTGTTEERSNEFNFMQGAQAATGIPPQSATNCVISANEGIFESDYTATVTVMLENGKSFPFYERGRATTVNHVDTISRCKTMPLDQMPKVTNGETIKGEDIQPVKRAIEERDIWVGRRGLRLFA